MMGEQKKYEMLLINSNPPLYVIKALRDIPEIGVRKGDKGGIIESEKNLSQEGSGWIEFDSMVRGFSRVENGYVGGKSTLSGNVILSRGIVLNSNIDGDMEIKGDIKIENSELLRNGRYYSSGIIRDSNLENCFFSKPFHIDSTTIKASRQFYAYEEVKMKCVEMVVDSAETNGNLDFKNVTIKVPSFYGNETLAMEYVTINLSYSFEIEDEYNNSHSKSTLIGNEDSPLSFNGGFVHIHNVSIKGASCFSGEIWIEESVIEGVNTIDMKNGVIKKSKILDCVTIKQTESEQYIISHKRLEGDTVYNCKRETYTFGF